MNLNYKDICWILAGLRKSPRVPSVKRLMEMYEAGEINILFQNSSDAWDGITIFDNGYVIYGDNERVTVFAIIKYFYDKNVLDLETGLPVESHVEDPMNEDMGDYGIPRWQVDMAMYGEKRLYHSKTSSVHQKELPTKSEDLDAYFDDGERDFDMDVCNEMYVADLLSCLNKKQERVIRLYYWEKLTFEEIATILNAYYEEKGINKHATRQSVSQMASRAIKKMRKCMKENKKFWF